LLRFRNASALLRAFQPQFPLVLPFMQIIEGNQRQHVSERPVRIAREEVKLVQNFGLEVGIRRFELRLDLFPG